MNAILVPVKSDDPPQVCIIIAAHNPAVTIRKAIDSALTQSAAGEVIVVDDASTDDTWVVAVCADDSTGRLRIIRLDHNEGPAAARNHA